MSGSDRVCPDDGSPAAEITIDPIPPELAARYRKLEPFASGATGQLFLVEAAPGGPALLKLFSDGAGVSLAERTRVRRELRKQATLLHTHLPRIHDHGEAAGRLWLLRDYVSGESLAVRLRRQGPLQLPEALAVVAQLASSLDELHRQGLLHRDLKPGHVLLSAGQPPRVILIDAGIAARLPGDAMFESVGTAAYAAPELASGKPASFRTDLYALGCVMYEILSGAPPFAAGSAESVLAAQRDQEPKPLDVELPPAIALLLTTLLAKEARRRPFSAQQVRRSLEPYLPKGMPEVQSTLRSVTPPTAASSSPGSLAAGRASDSTQDIAIDELELLGRESSALRTQELDLADIEEAVARRIQGDSESALRTQELSLADIESLVIGPRTQELSLSDIESVPASRASKPPGRTSAVPPARPGAAAGSGASRPPVVGSTTRPGSRIPTPAGLQPKTQPGLPLPSTPPPRPSTLSTTSPGSVRARGITLPPEPGSEPRLGRPGDAKSGRPAGEAPPPPAAAGAVRGRSMTVAGGWSSGVKPAADPKQADEDAAALSALVDEVASGDPRAHRPVASDAEAILKATPSSAGSAVSPASRDTEPGRSRRISSFPKAPPPEPAFHRRTSTPPGLGDSRIPPAADGGKRSFSPGGAPSAGARIPATRAPSIGNGPTPRSIKPVRPDFDVESLFKDDEPVPARVSDPTKFGEREPDSSRLGALRDPITKPQRFFEDAESSKLAQPPAGQGATDTIATDPPSFAEVRDAVGESAAAQSGNADERDSSVDQSATTSAWRSEDAVKKLLPSLKRFGWLRGESSATADAAASGEGVFGSSDESSSATASAPASSKRFSWLRGKSRASESPSTNAGSEPNGSVFDRPSSPVDATANGDGAFGKSHPLSSKADAASGGGAFGESMQASSSTAEGGAFGRSHESPSNGEAHESSSSGTDAAALSPAKDSSSTTAAAAESGKRFGWLRGKSRANESPSSSGDRTRAVVDEVNDGAGIASSVAAGSMTSGDHVTSGGTPIASLGGRSSESSADRTGGLRATSSESSVATGASASSDRIDAATGQSSESAASFASGVSSESAASSTGASERFGIAGASSKSRSSSAGAFSSGDVRGAAHELPSASSSAGAFASAERSGGGSAWLDADESAAANPIGATEQRSQGFVVGGAAALDTLSTGASASAHGLAGAPTVLGAPASDTMASEPPAFATVAAANAPPEFVVPPATSATSGTRPSVRPVTKRKRPVLLLSAAALLFLIALTVMLVRPKRPVADNSAPSAVVKVAVPTPAKPAEAPAESSKPHSEGQLVATADPQPSAADTDNLAQADVQPSAVDEPRESETSANTSAGAAGSGTLTAAAAGKPYLRGGVEPGGVVTYRSRREPSVDYKGKARELFSAGKFREAADAYQRAAQKTPSDAGAFAGLGASWLSAGEADRSIMAYQRAVQLKPDVSGFQAALGRAYLTKGDKGRASAAYNKALALDPHNQAAKSGLATLR